MTNFDLSTLNGNNGFIVDGIDARDSLGFSVSSAGDVNGDGIDDIIVGAYNADPHGDSSGESYVIFGKGEGFGSSLQLSSLDGNDGFTINGIGTVDISGFSVSSAGDVNGDGIDDIIVGASNADPNDKNEAGESYVVFGNREGFDANLELDSLDGTNGFTINGASEGDKSGRAVGSVGDINNDGIDDIIVGAIQAQAFKDPQDSQTVPVDYIVYGNSNGFSSNLELNSLDGDNGFLIYGALGISVSHAGDVNADGIDDFIIGSNTNAPNQKRSAGESHVVFGRDGGFGESLDLSTLDGNNGFVINGIDEFDFSGISVSHAGDVNADGIDDVIVGAYFAAPNGNNRAGESYVVFGSSEEFDASLELDSLDGTNGFVINGISAGDNSGISVSNAGDVNNDGVDDIIIGASKGDPDGGIDAGESYIVFGSREGFDESLNLSDLDGINGYIINGIDAQDNSGISVSHAGDINNDGVDDIVIGAHKADPKGRSLAGESYVVFGEVGDQMIVGTSEDDALFGGVGNDTIEGLEQNDYLEGRAGNDLLDAGSGNDVLGGGEGTDSLLGYDGNDTLLGGSDNDTLKGGADRDNLLGHDDNDILIGNVGNDTLRGGAGKDFLKGGHDNDILFGNSADDTLHGGHGRDIFVFKGHVYGTDTIQDFNLGEDRIALGNGYNFESIEITGDVDSILSFNDSQIAIVQNVSPGDLSANHFIDM